MEVFFTFSFFMIGAVFGSFFNVVGLRVPKKIPFTTGRSYCPHCHKQLRFYELIPIVSFIMQKGKCRSCQARISFIYPFVELLTGILFAFSFSKIGFAPELVVTLLFVSLLMIIFVSDMAYMIIPDKVLLFFLPLFVTLRIFVPLEPWYDALIGAAVGYILIALIIIFSNGGMGGGDMKLFGVIGFVLGWKYVLLAFFLAALFGAVVGGMFMLLKKVERKEPIPFGPFIVFGALISYFYGEKIIDIYLSLL